MPFLRWALRLMSPVIIFHMCIFTVLSLFCSFVDVVCVMRLLSSVTGLTAHPLSLSFEGKDKVVMRSPHIWLVGLAGATSSRWCLGPASPRSLLWATVGVTR